MQRVTARLARRLRRLSPGQRVLSAVTGLVLLAGLLLLILTVAFSSTKTAGGHHTKPTMPSSTTTTTTPAHHHHHANTHDCPLTGLLAPGGKVPQRPAIGIKIGNDPASRPQTGLQNADIVYEEMAEGGITRYLAVYQCQQAPALGPVRSVRWDDWHVLASYGHPILAFSGGIDQWNTLVAGLHWLYDANGSFYPMANAYYRTSDRVAPWNYFTSTSRLWALDPSNVTPPQQQFTYRTKPAATSQAVQGATVVGFASGENVVWQWNPSAKTWERFYGSQPDTDSSGAQLHATNVVIQVVKAYPGACCESGTTPDTNSITEGTGTAYVLRDGHLERGTWTTPIYGSIMHLRLANGSVMALEPGNTWVEMVPDTYAVQFEGLK
jgi:hypothetical protein